MKGDTFTFIPQKHEDEGISPQILRITDENNTCNHLYFTSRSFTPDDKKVVFISDRDGGFNLFCIDLETNAVKQLTEGKTLDYFPYVARDGKSVFYGDKGCIREVNIETLEEKTLIDAAELVGHEVFKCSGTYQSWDGKKIVCFFEAKPDFGLIVIDLETGKSKVILQGDQPVRHCQFCPLDHNLIVYAHEGDWSTMQARMWLINADGTGNRRVRDHDDGTVESVGHEFWANTEKKLYFKIQREGKIFVANFDLNANKETVMFEMRHNHGTITTDDKYFIADDKHGEMHIVNLATGEERHLCYPYMSWVKGMSRFHPHPTVSNKGDRVVYTSDHFEKPGVFVAEIPRF